MAKITINDFAKKAYKKYIAAGMTPEGACGLMGNQYAESAGFLANRVEFLCLRRLKEHGKVYTDETYTAAVNSGKISKAEFLNPLPGKQYGYSLSQWTTPKRKSGLYEATVEKGKSIADEDAVLQYVIDELKASFPKTFNILKTTKSVKSASDYVLIHYESPADTGTSIKNIRADYSQQYYDYFVKQKGADASVPSNNTLVQKVIDDAVTFAVSIANDNSHGYSQAVRSLYNISNPKSFDCSSLVCTAYYYAFTKNGLTKQANYLKSNCSYTGNMLNMLNCGFEVVATNQTAHSKMAKGDIELNVTHHTALAIDSNNIVHARSSEGTSNTIDDSGNEIRTQGWYLYSHGWTHRLRFTGKGITASGVSSNTSNGASNVSGGGSTSTLLRKGSKGQAVKELQEKLNKLGYGLTVDGDFGSKTESAVISFQKKYNLEVDGVVGNETRNALDSAIKALTAKPTQPQSDSWVGEVNVSAGSTLAVRTWAGTEYPKIKSYPELGRGNRVRVLGSLKAIDGSTWYKIAINNAKTNNKDIIGFVSSKYIKKVQ
jgi:hypothetical protein